MYIHTLCACIANTLTLTDLIAANPSLVTNRMTNIWPSPASFCTLVTLFIILSADKWTLCRSRLCDFWLITAPLKLRPYGAIEIRLLLLFYTLSVDIFKSYATTLWKPMFCLPRSACTARSQVWLGLPNGRFQSGGSLRITAESDLHLRAVRGWTPSRGLLSEAISGEGYSRRTTLGARRGGQAETEPWKRRPTQAVKIGAGQLQHDCMLTGRLLGTIVGPTGRSDWSVQLVGPTIVSCKRFVRPVGQTVGCLISSDCRRSDCRSVWTLRPTGRTDRPVGWPITLQRRRYLSLTS